MKYCHQNNVCHRDLKLENILIDDTDNVKIIDFGFSADTTKNLNNYCGTPPYMPPEITLKGFYTGK
jgi:serine/threonine protein kinase